MDIITIVFIGLIAHVTTTSGETSVLVRAPGHLANVTVIRANGTVETPFDLNDTYVAIKGAATTATAKQLIKDKIPELEDIGKCKTLKTSVDARTRDSGVTSYFDHAGGELDTVWYQPKTIAFEHGNKWKNAHCAACGAQFTMRARAATLSIANIDDKTKPIKTFALRAGDRVIVRNAPPPDPNNTAPATDHFPHFYELFTDCKTKDKVKVVGDCTAPQCTDIDPQFISTNLPLKFFKLAPKQTHSHSSTLRLDQQVFARLMHMPSVECTNSQYP